MPSILSLQNKPLFGGGGGAFGAPAVSSAPFGQTTNTFGAPTTAATGGGLFGAKPAGAAFGAPAASAGGFGGFGATPTSQAGGGLFGQPVSK